MFLLLRVDMIVAVAADDVVIATVAVCASFSGLLPFCVFYHCLCFLLCVVQMGLRHVCVRAP